MQGPTGNDNPADGSKFMWTQTRQCYMFAALARYQPHDPRWLALAKHGRDFIVARGHLGGGRWAYQLTREGAVQDSSASWYTDTGALMALCEYKRASCGEDDDALIALTFDHVLAAYDRLVGPDNLNPDGGAFNDFFHFQFADGKMAQGPHMIMMNLLRTIMPVVGAERCIPRIDRAVRLLTTVFFRPDDHGGTFFEIIEKDGTPIDEAKRETTGSLGDSSSSSENLNPGHCLELVWPVKILQSTYFTHWS